ncbi:uncharacterized protein isoform X1 [Choristoneura fumiferana]|uniref:uncharacterized protein isoform X1 n=1 Tax=Choristoneura fumiferana TaxID=7141 RepID=UPI003D15F184
MESSAGRRRASDAEQSARACSASVKCEPVMVKEEPEWSECGASEAPVAEGLYVGHEIKDELVIGPEVFQQRVITFSIQDGLNIKDESRDEHKPKLAGGATTHACSGNGPRCTRSSEQQHGLRSCFVLLQRLPVEELHSSTPVYGSRGGELSHNRAPSRQQPAHCGVGSSRTMEEPASSQPHPGDEWFRPKLTLTQHARLSSGERAYGRVMCGEWLKRKSDLKSHISPYKDKKLYSCDVCGKCFTAKSSLIRHKLSHTGERPHSCDVCNKRFREKSHLTQHVRIHTGEKPYSCDVCNKQFRERSYWTAHMRIHTGAKPYSCDVCNKSYTRRSTLNIHMLKLKHIGTA